MASGRRAPGDRHLGFESLERQRWHLAAIAACVAIAVVSSVWLIALGYRSEFAIVRIAAYSLSFIVAGSIAWVGPDKPARW